ncbi:hypothetical protein ACUSIJ_24900 [Pseudochelatococcus sp. B33]
MSDDARIAALEARIATLEDAVARIEQFRILAPHEEARLRCELTQEIGQLTRRLELCERLSGRTAE